jgi:hypothetical protein
MTKVIRKIANFLSEKRSKMPNNIGHNIIFEEKFSRKLPISFPRRSSKPKVLIITLAPRTRTTSRRRCSRRSGSSTATATASSPGTDFTKLYFVRNVSDNFFLFFDTFASSFFTDFHPKIT